MAIEATESKGANESKIASGPKLVTEAMEAISANNPSEAKDAIGALKVVARVEAVKAVEAVEPVEAKDPNEAKDAFEDIKRQLAQLSEYRTKKYLLTIDEQELLLELLNSESLERNAFVHREDCVPFTLNDFNAGNDSIRQITLYKALIEKIQRRIRLITSHNVRSNQMVFSCFNSKNPRPLEIALIIIKYAHYNLMAHHFAKVALQMRDPDYYPKKFDKRFEQSGDDWDNNEFSYTVRKILSTLIREISFTQYLFPFGAVAQLIHLFVDKITAIKAKIHELPITKQGKKQLKDQIQSGTISIISSGPSDNVLITHNNLKKHALDLQRRAEENDPHKYTLLTIMQLINALENNRENNIIDAIHYRIEKLQFIITQCRPLLVVNKPLSADFVVSFSAPTTQNRNETSSNIYESIIKDAITDINALRASTHYVLSKPAIPERVKPPVRSTTPPPRPDIVVTLHSPTSKLRRAGWGNLLTRSTSPEPVPVYHYLDSDKPKAAPPVNSLFPPARESAPSSEPKNPIAPQANESRDSSRVCCFF